MQTFVNLKKIFLYKFVTTTKKKQNKMTFINKNNVFHQVFNKTASTNTINFKECLEQIMEDNYFTYFYIFKNINNNKHTHNHNKHKHRSI